MLGNFYNALLVLYGLDKPSFTAKLKKENRFEEFTKQFESLMQLSLFWPIADVTYVGIDFLKAGEFSSQYKRRCQIVYRKELRASK